MPSHQRPSKAEPRRPPGSGVRAALVAAAIAGVLAAACAPRDDVREAEPCPGAQPISLGEPENIDNSYATFHVVSGPVWVTVTTWEPNWATSTPFSAPLFIGPESTPPDGPEAAVATLADQTVDVVEDQYTRVELEPGVYWVLTNSVVGEVAAVACDGGEIGEVVSTP